jgi:cell wall-associated NlpC family hydrolase
MRPANVLPILAAAVLLAARPAAGQVEVIIGGPDPTPPPRAAQANKADTNAASAGAASADAAHADTARPSSARTASRAYLVSMLGAQVADYALKFVGAPYLWGGAGPGGFDCSGYTQYVFRQFGIAIPRTADAQFASGGWIGGDPLPGDLVFFQTYDYGASHVGVYLGNGSFVSSIGAGVHVSSFASAYFTSRYLGARRFVPSY